MTEAVQIGVDPGLDGAIVVLTAPGVTLSPTLAEGFKPVDTREEVSKRAGISHGSLDKVEAIKAANPEPEILEAVRAGQLGQRKFRSEHRPPPDRAHSGLLTGACGCWPENNQNPKAGYCRHSPFAPRVRSVWPQGSLMGGTPLAARLISDAPLLLVQKE